MKFTYREAKKLLKTKDTNKKGHTSADVVARRKALDNARYAGETRRLLARLGVSDEEQETYVKLSEACNVGRQELNKQSQRTLFGEGGTDDTACRFTNSDDDEVGYSSGFVGERLAIRFLKGTEDTKTAACGYGSKKAKSSDLGSNRVYFLTVALGTSQTNNSRKPEAVLLCLPPANGSVHKTHNAAQERLADLMIMKLYFVARYVYNTLKKEITTSSASTSFHPRYPVIVVRRTGPVGGDPHHCAWYRMLKEKIAKGEDSYARQLSLNYNCNVI